MIKFSICLLCVFLCCFSCGEKSVVQTEMSLPETPLIEDAQLEGILDHPKVKLIDLRTEEEFLREHIPGAQLVTRPDMEDGNPKLEGMMASKSQAEALLSKLGISPDDLIVLYDNKGNPDACRLYWILEVYGHQRKAILNGGFVAWKHANKAISSRPSSFKKTHYRFKSEAKPQQLATIEDVKKALNDSSYLLIDTRTEAEFTGTSRKGKVDRAGHIPGSIHIDHEWNIDQENKYRFKTLAALKDLYADIPKDKKIIVYCHSGVRSSLTTFVLTKLLDYKHVKNYDGSWIEWSAHPELPIGQKTLKVS